jgi:tetratricopeptide (TPR) repeat protein
VKVGPWEIEGEIGRGGSGVVYRGRGPDGRAVAIKVLLAARGDASSRFEREARLQGELGEAAGFVPVLDVGTSQGTPYIVMPFIPGGTLRSRFGRAMLPVEEVRALGRALARALGAAHARGIVHRDVKPENVLFTERGVPLLADLGLAKHFDRSALGASRSASLSTQGSFRGTVGYTAPEQLADAKSVGPAADVFSLGAVLYECLAGKPAFEGDTVLELIDRSTAASFAPVRRLRPETPPALAAAVERALARDPRERFSDGVTFERALARTSSRRNPIWLLGLVLVVVGLAAVFMARSRREPGPKAPPPARSGPRVAELVARAEELVLLQDMTGAARVASEAVTLDPASGDAHALRAVALYYLNRHEEARAEVARAGAQRSPRVLGAVAFLAPPAERPALAARATESAPSSALVWGIRAGTENMAGHTAEAVAAAERSLALEPRNSLAWSIKGGAAAKLADYPLAVKCFSEAVRLAPGRASNWGMLGQLKLALKERDEALADAERALSIEPEESIALSVRGLVRYDRGDFQAAIVDLSKAVSFGLPNPRVWLARGVSRTRTGDPERAVSDIDHAIDMGEPATDVYYLRAKARVLLKDPRGARDDYERATGGSPSSVLAAEAKRWLAANPASADPPRDEQRSPKELLAAANARRAARDHQGSIELATLAIRGDPAEPMGWLTRALGRTGVGDNAGAMADAQQAVDLRPGGDTFALRGYVKRLSGDLDGAVADADRAIELDPADPNGFSGRSSVRKMKGDLRGALLDAREAVRLAPERETFVYALGSAEYANGDIAAARAAFERYLELAPEGSEARLARAWLKEHPR